MVFNLFIVGDKKRSAAFLLDVFISTPLYGSDGTSFGEKVEEYIEKLKQIEAAIHIEPNVGFQGRREEVEQILNMFCSGDKKDQKIGNPNIVIS